MCMGKRKIQEKKTEWTEVKKSVVVRKRKGKYSVDGIHCLAYRLRVPVRIESELSQALRSRFTIKRDYSITFDIAHFNRTASRNRICDFHDLLNFLIYIFFILNINCKQKLLQYFFYNNRSVFICKSYCKYRNKKTLSIGRNGEMLFTRMFCYNLIRK